ncbi:hypothetical protein OESDEN_13304 [Oesophagostomum dentatum]|uniref:SCP domain-containing protein n=1 Tax=Oesophagostomum dentatum TaxID=61180 RepID=A0A0B1STS5_OESDE|nr:hypothetical protein OESDEN_13304 [Oesophagostomum dentatum]
MPTLEILKVYCCELEKTAIERASLCEQMDSVPQGILIENNYNFTKNLNRTLATAANNAAQLWWSEITKLESGIDQIQNLYYTHLGINSFAKAAQLWWSEITKLESGIDQIQNLYYTHLGINSFAKMASDLTTGVGCAVVHCGNRINVVCHYDTTLANAVKLYTCGPTCNRCENGTSSCVNGLCPAASETCSVATTTAAPEATTTTTEPNTLCPNNHGMTDPLRFAILAKHNSLRTALALGTVENGQTGVMCRKASKMPTLTYSCNLECTALARASKCSQMDSTPPQCISENSYNFTKNLNRTLSQAANAVCFSS